MSLLNVVRAHAHQTAHHAINSSTTNSPAVSPEKQAYRNSDRTFISELCDPLCSNHASAAMQVDNAGIDILLVGDSVAMVVHGHDTTLPVTLDDMILHCKAVYRGARR